MAEEIIIINNKRLKVYLFTKVSTNKIHYHSRAISLKITKQKRINQDETNMIPQRDPLESELVGKDMHLH